MKNLLFGVAYYDEYMPYDRLQEDIKMMKEANINVVRIAESTWSTVEPQNGVFNFEHIDRVIDAMEEAGLYVIVGTPTYAVPTWLVKEDPHVLATTKAGQGVYGARQIMDITNKTYLFYAERVIRKIMSRVAHRKCVIGFQLDNETKHYDTAGEAVQRRFVKYLKDKFETTDALNKEFGLDYWSNRINAWEDFPNVLGTINGSLGGEFEKFQRILVEEFLAWQADIIRDYSREDQFITHNFDFEWRNYSYGIQPRVNHFEACKSLTIAGCDIYHPTQDELTGTEISFGGDLTRSIKQANYLVLETEAQGFADWVPYDGQLRLQAFSHIASGANSVMYWHWHSLHNSFETYWKGLLSHDLKENETYKEAKVIGHEFKEFGHHLINLKKSNKVAIVVNNESLTALEWFKLGSGNVNYNDVVRWVYDALYQLNVECDFIHTNFQDLGRYDLIIIPALYSAPDSFFHRLNEYVEAGGYIVATFKSAFTNEHVKVSHQVQPRIINNCCGVTYNQFTIPKNVSLVGHSYELSEEDNQASIFMELLQPTTAEVLAWYGHFNWGRYAAITQNNYGKGKAYYIGTMTSLKFLKALLIDILREIKLYDIEQQYEFPIIIKKGINDFNKKIVYYFNYSNEVKELTYVHERGIELTSGKRISTNERIVIKPWNFLVIEQN